MNTQTRLATLERHLQRYLATVVPPTTNPRQWKRRLTYRRWVIRRNLRQQRALLTNGHEVGWTQVTLTDEDEARAERLATQPPIVYPI